MKKFLKFYLWFYVPLGIFGMFTVAEAPVSDNFDLIRNLISLFLSPVAIYLYAYEKNWLSSMFWKFFSFLFVADAVYDIFYMQRVYPKLPFLAVFISWAFGVVIIIPAFYAQFAYAFKKAK